LVVEVADKFYPRDKFVAIQSVKINLSAHVIPVVENNRAIQPLSIG